MTQSDRRLFPANDRVASTALRGVIDHSNFVMGQEMQICHPLVDLCKTPAGLRDRQLVYGDHVQVFDIHLGYAFVQNDYDGYVGYIPANTLATRTAPTHRISATATHVYAEPNMKSPDVAWLPCGATFATVGETEKFLCCPIGWIPKQHCALISEWENDPVDVATKFLNAPYLWGGNSTRGIDCSGLVQISLRSCGWASPADSDQQMTLGKSVDPGEYKRNDLLFWAGHVALVIDANTIIHANAHSMTVCTENISSAIHRITSSGGGGITAHKRP